MSVDIQQGEIYVTVQQIIDTDSSLRDIIGAYCRLPAEAYCKYEYDYEHGMMTMYRTFGFSRLQDTRFLQTRWIKRSCLKMAVQYLSWMESIGAILWESLRPKLEVVALRIHGEGFTRFGPAITQLD